MGIGLPRITSMTADSVMKTVVLMTQPINTGRIMINN